MAKTLKAVLPREFMGCEFENSLARKYAEHEVVAEHDARQKPWPGHHVNVNYWWELDNGYAVGWNENPARGWAFPIIRLREEQRSRNTIGGTSPVKSHEEKTDKA